MPRNEARGRVGGRIYELSTIVRLKFPCRKEGIVCKFIILHIKLHYLYTYVTCMYNVWNIVRIYVHLCSQENLQSKLDKLRDGMSHSNTYVQHSIHTYVHVTYIMFCCGRDELDTGNV